MFIQPNPNVANFSILNSGLFGLAKESKAIGFMSGYTYFDYPTAYNDIDGRTGFILPNGGLFPRLYPCIGDSGTGKSTTMIQLGCAIVDRSIGGTLVMMDPEGNTSPERIKSLNNWSDIEYKRKCLYIPPSPPLTINGVYDIVRKIAHSKAVMKNKIMITTPYKDSYTGEFIKTYPVTVCILDSVPALVISQTLEDAIDGSKEFKSVEQIGNNIDGMREAKDNTNFLRKVKSILDEYNIILIPINHITKEAQMGMFDKPKKHHPNLKAGEKLKGGYEWIYQAFGMFRMHQKEPINDRNPIYGDTIRGGINSLEFVKNKSNVSSSEYRFVFDRRTGFRAELSDLEYLLDKKQGLSGSAMSMCVTILPEIRFTRKNLVEKCGEHPMLSRAISFTARYIIGNDVILQNRFGEIDLEAFGKLPLSYRYSVLTSMTIPYSIFSINTFGNELMLKDQIKSTEGNVYTNLTGDYVSPLNIEYIQNITDNYNRGYCACEVTGNDPIKCRLK